MSEPLLASVETSIPRRVFLRRAIQAFAATSVVVGGGSLGLQCGPGGDVPELRGISQQEYRNMRAIQEVILRGLPFGFDLGLALDQYVYGHPHPLPTKDLVHELAGAPSSWLAALLLDGSLTTLVALPPEKREARMLKWQASDDVMQRGLYNILRQTSFFLVSMTREYNEYCGYDLDGGFQPYNYKRPA